MATRSARRPLNSERVVVSALRLIDRHGVEALSMRRLGAALGVEAMSLYKHVPNKAALLDSVLAHVLTEIRPAPDRAAWRARLRHVAHEFRRLALAHPQVFPLLVTRIPSLPSAFAPVEEMLAALSEAGHDDAELLGHFWAFVAYFSGALLSETAALTGAGSAALEVPTALDPAEFPALTRLGPALADCDFEREFARGLELMLEAVAP